MSFLPPLVVSIKTRFKYLYRCGLIRQLYIQKTISFTVKDNTITKGKKRWLERWDLKEKLKASWHQLAAWNLRFDGCYSRLNSGLDGLSSQRMKELIMQKQVLIIIKITFQSKLYLVTWTYSFCYNCSLLLGYIRHKLNFGVDGIQI